MNTLTYCRRAMLCALTVAAAAGWIGAASAQNRTFSFAYDQPTTTAYGIAANIFDAKLKELSGGKMSINQFPGAQLGQEPQMLQKLRAGHEAQEQQERDAFAQKLADKLGISVAKVKSVLAAGPFGMHGGPHHPHR